ncbi:MAG: RNA polymerase subunit sigma-24 [Bacteroidetes bacterium HGW-Bacteroidetes-1]|jgi:RNA polymerase sigma-70 factor (ECF subfamily)|nr:MAG: RNA polymerase subunit sigma-24 [Bacteroidetes bacterium HGW-Bacteroidetes-1]
MDSEKWIIEALTFKDKLYRFALRMLGDCEEASDAVQETYIKLWKMFAQQNSHSNIEALAMTITKNYCLDQLKSKLWQSERLEMNSLQQMQSGNGNGESLLELKDAYDTMKQFIGVLPKQQQMVIHLRDVEQLELNEIASITGLNENAVRVNLSRARKTVRQLLTNHYNYEYTGN